MRELAKTYRRTANRTDRLKTAYDAVVIGAGHNGLVAAAYLARAGMKVGVFERRPVVGGAAVTEELWKGFKISRLSYSYGLFDPKIVSDLKLQKFGLRVIHSEADLFVPFPDGKYIFVWIDPVRTAKEFRPFSEHDARNYPKYLEFWERLEETMRPLKYRAKLAPSDLFEVFERRKALDDLRMALFGSVSQLLDEYFESEYVKGALCPRGLIGTFVGPKTPGSAWVLAYHVMGESSGTSGAWGWLAGGNGALSNSIAACARSFGVEIMTGHGVVRILVDGKAAGVELDDGTKVRAKHIVSNADPKQTFLKLVGKEHLDSAFAAATEKIRDEGCVVKVNAAIRELPDYKALQGTPGPQHRAISGIGPTVDYCEAAFDDAKRGAPSRNPFLRIGHHSANDPSMAPPGKHVMSIFSQYFPYHLKAGNWDEIREEVGDNILQTLTEYAPNMKSSVIAREVLTPLDLEREFSLPKGNIFHSEITPDQMFFMRPVPGWSGYDTPIKNLYLCGSGARPGGGVTGLPGHNAAKVVLAAARRK
jgi:phytoene dehydrogenase-like protein